MSKWNPRTPMPPAPAGFWRDIPNHPGYQASIDGEVRRVYPDGTVRILRECRMGAVRLEINGEWITAMTARLMWLTFRGPVPQGKRIQHINGDRHDHRIGNLRPCEDGMSGRPSANRKPVAKVRYSTGDVVELYPSVTAAADANGCSDTTMSRLLQTGEYHSGGVRYIYAEDLTDRRRGRPRK